MKGAPSQTTVELVIKEKVAEIILVGPEGKPPTIDQTVLANLEKAIEEIAKSDAQLTFVKSNSEKFFCVGANINVLKEMDVETIGPWVRKGHRVFNKLEDLPCPVVAIVKGYAMGGGLELAMACDLIFASDTAKFAQSEARLGFIPGWGGSQRLVERIGIAKAKYFFYTGEMLDSKAALECGLIDFAGTEKELLDFFMAFLKNVLSNNYNAISTFKKIVNSEMLEQRNRNVEQEAVNSISCMKDKDTLNRLNAFLNRKG